MALKLGSLYSGGVDAFAFAAMKLGMEVRWHVEKNVELHKYLKKNYPNSKIYRYDDRVGKRNLESVDIICGGDPCQPSSNSGVRLGTADYRYRWPQMFRICGELRPRWIINENVVGSISNMVLDQKISDLASIGYTCQPYNIPAVSVGAHHERQRIFLVAHTNVQGWREPLSLKPGKFFKKSGQTITLGAQGDAFLQYEERFMRPAILPISDGIPDHVTRLGAAGNAIVSPIPIILLMCIQEIEKGYGAM